MPCRSSQRLTGQLVTKPSIIPICIRNQWLELSIGAFQMEYCASAIQPNRPTSKLSTESVSDLIASRSGASRPTWWRNGAIAKYWKRIPNVQASGRSRMYSGPRAAVEPIAQPLAQTIHSPPMSPSAQPAPQWVSESDTCHHESRARSFIPAARVCIRLRDICRPRAKYAQRASGPMESAASGKARFMIGMCCRLPSTTMSVTMTSADANPSASATHARSSNQLGATRNHHRGAARADGRRTGAARPLREQLAECELPADLTIRVLRGVDASAVMDLPL